MATKTWKKETLTRDTLLRIAYSPFTLFSANSSPYFLHRLAKLFFKDRATKMVRSRTKKLRELEARRLLRFQKTQKDALKISLTPIGQAIVKKLWFQRELEEIKPNTLKPWSGKWHLLIYDLSGLNKNTKDNLRKAIKRWKFYQIKRTVWVSPYDCEKELVKLCKALKINQEKIIYVATDKIAQEEKLKKHFNL